MKEKNKAFWKRVEIDRNKVKKWPKWMQDIEISAKAASTGNFVKKKGKGTMKRFWGGFEHDELAFTEESLAGCLIYAIYQTKKQAKLCYSDVRELTIEIKNKSMKGY